ncbi:hypothetical protein HPB48_009917 [Haemaphysalis longicornis]|uniref:Uncharacterized protein n=1 Tax=Haemaphysalis longicornis TaxID=44386 RepID=A0A9J6GU95_HAELO|nr:hypothetical protein HPB48_009917 [Haemaphysalis longicornis]
MLATPTSLKPHHSSSTLAVTDNEGTVLNAATFLHLSSTVAEATTTALAAAAHTHTTHLTIVTDSHQACRYYLLGKKTPAALKIFDAIPDLPTITILWPRDMPLSLVIKQHMLRHASFTFANCLQGEAARTLGAQLSILFPLASATFYRTTFTLAEGIHSPNLPSLSKNHKSGSD